MLKIFYILHFKFIFFTLKIKINIIETFLNLHAMEFLKTMTE